MAINWGLLGNQQGQFQNALAMGAQIGSAAAERKNQEGYRNALMNYDPSNPDSAKEVMRFSPEVGFKLQQQAVAQQQAAGDAQVARMAYNGDNEALGELFIRNPDLWTKLDDRSKEQTKQATSIMANSAMQIGRLPEAQRAQAWATAVAEAERSGIDIPPYMESYSPAVLDSALARAEMTEKYIQQFEPDWRAVPQGGYLEDVNPLTNPTIGGQQPTQPQILPATSRPAGKSDAQLIQEARDAIEAGVNVDTVFRQLKAWGVNP